MKYENTYDVIVNGYEVAGDDGACDFATEVPLMCEDSVLQTESIAYGRYIDTVMGVNVYYDYGADYYFFTKEGE